MTAYRNVRPAVAEFACVSVNDPFVTALTYIVPLPISTAALAEAGVRIGVEPCAQFAVVTVVVADPVASVTLPTAFDRPAARCCSASTIFFRSVSVIPGT
jgi:hypothetical protein